MTSSLLSDPPPSSQIVPPTPFMPPPPAGLSDPPPSSQIVTLTPFASQQSQYSAPPSQPRRFQAQVEDAPDDAVPHPHGFSEEQVRDFLKAGGLVDCGFDRFKAIIFGNEVEMFAAYGKKPAAGEAGARATRRVGGAKTRSGWAWAGAVGRRRRSSTSRGSLGAR